VPHTAARSLVPAIFSLLTAVTVVIALGLVVSLAVSIGYRLFGPRPFNERVAGAETAAKVLTGAITLEMPLKQAEAVVEAHGFQVDESGSAVIATRRVSEFFNSCEVSVSFDYDMSLTITGIESPHKACGSL
jgi:hypothetical protein